jgi:hypothetical protein
MNRIDKEPNLQVDPALAPGSEGRFLASPVRWLDRIDPGGHRRIKGLRLVTAYGIAARLGTNDGYCVGPARRAGA